MVDTIFSFKVEKKHCFYLIWFLSTEIQCIICFKPNVNMTLYKKWIQECIDAFGIKYFFFFGVFFIEKYWYVNGELQLQTAREGIKKNKDWKLQIWRMQESTNFALFPVKKLEKKQTVCPFSAIFWRRKSQETHILFTVDKNLSFFQDLGIRLLKHY